MIRFMVHFTPCSMNNRARDLAKVSANRVVAAIETNLAPQAPQCKLIPKCLEIDPVSLRNHQGPNLRTHSSHLNLSSTSLTMLTATARHALAL